MNNMFNEHILGAMEKGLRFSPARQQCCECAAFLSDPEKCPSVSVNSPNSMCHCHCYTLKELLMEMKRIGKHPSLYCDHEGWKMSIWLTQHQHITGVGTSDPESAILDCLKACYAIKKPQ